ncbi:MULTISPECIES: cellulose biosynthesis cyclic di-GMP-binding regulatory protein BcsB [Listeria]|uniref:cellulose biosynthesis cyclic di-GMP-binding regulatory protein BcsB n=1 Tax=Listeria TaxID=1637 RepID=UPI000B589A8A|nr:MULTISPECIES: cellulose biosynthesis cyclic di-GMP-binding regulatory protein BcsB [Listeria]
MKKLGVLAVLLGIFFFAGMQLHAEAATYQTVLGVDKEARGKYTTTKQNFTIENYWNTKTVKVKLVYRVTQLSEQEVSTITFSVNDVPFYSFRPAKGETGVQEVTVDVPVDKLKKGSNVLSIEGFIYTTLPDNQCTIDDTPANWLHIDKASSILVDYDAAAFKNTIADFNERFTGIDTVKNEQSGVFVSNQAANAEMTAGLQAVTAFAHENQLDDKQIAFGKYTERADKAYQLVIANFKDLPAGLQAGIDKAKLDDQAVMKLTRVSGKEVLVVTSNSDAALKTAAKLISNQALMSQLALNEKWVKKDEKVETPKSKVDKEIKLTEEGDKVKGIGHVEQDYFIKVPSNRSISDGTKVNLKYRYSSNLDFEHSLVTVLINGKPIGSQKLTAKKANDDSFTINVPKDMNIVGNFNVTVAFDLVLTDNYCGFINDSEIPWGFVTNESTFNLQTEEQQDFLFNNYPYPMIEDGQFNKAVVVLPDNPDANTMNALQNVFNLFGQFVDGNNGSLEAVKSADFKSANEASNIIAVGGLNDNTVIKQANDQLYFKYNKAGTYFLSNEKLKIDPSYGKRIGSVQLIPSIFNKENAILAITGPTSSTTELGATLLGSAEMLSKTYGDGAIMDTDDTIHAYRFKKVADAGEKTSFASKLTDNQATLAFVGVAIMTLIILIVATVLLLRKYRKK